MTSYNERLAFALRGMMSAYEHRIRSDCKTQAEIDKQPWRCAQYIVAEEALRPMPLLFSNDSLRRHIDTDPDDEPTAGPIEEARTRSKT